MRFRRSDKDDLARAKREREKSEQRLKDTKELVEHINLIREENHFADVIIDGVLRGHDR